MKDKTVGMKGRGVLMSCGSRKYCVVVETASGLEDTAISEVKMVMKLMEKKKSEVASQTFSVALNDEVINEVVQLFGQEQHLEKKEIFPAL